MIWALIRLSVCLWFFVVRASVADDLSCSASLEVESGEAFLGLVVLAYEEGVIDGARLEELVLSSNLFNPFRESELKEIGYFEQAVGLITQVDWVKTRPKLEQFLLKQKKKWELDDRDRAETQEVLFEHFRSDSTLTEYGRVKLLFEVDGPDDYRTLMVYIEEGEEAHFRIFDPVNGFGKTSYPINGEFLMTPVIFKMKGQLYLASILRDRLEVFSFDSNLEAEEIQKMEFEVPFPSLNDGSGRVVEPRRMIQVFYCRESPVLVLIGSKSSDRYYLPIETNREFRSHVVIEMAKGSRQFDYVFPLVAHQGGVPKLGLTDRGSFVEIEMDFNFYFEGNETVGAARQDHTRNYSLKIVPKRSLLTEPIRGTYRAMDRYSFESRVRYAGDQKVLVTAIYNPHTMGIRGDIRSYIALYFLDSGQFRLVRIPQGTWPDSNITFVKSSEGEVSLVAYLLDNNFTAGTSSMAWPSSLFLYHLETETWEALREGVGFYKSDNILMVLKGQAPGHRSANWLSQVGGESGRSSDLLYRTQFDSEPSVWLWFYDLETDFLASQVVPGGQRSSRPHLYRDSKSGERRLVFLSGEIEGRESFFEHYRLHY